MDKTIQMNKKSRMDMYSYAAQGPVVNLTIQLFLGLTENAWSTETTHVAPTQTTTYYVTVVMASILVKTVLR